MTKTELRLPNFAESHAVLIGTGTYVTTELDGLPGALRNLDGMRDILLDNGLSGFLDSHVTLVPDPAQADQIMAAVSIAGEQATDVLLVYYAGHGLLMGEISELYLTLTQSRSDARWNALPFNYLADEIRRSKALTKIVILDCCYSGRARKYLMGNPARFVEEQLSSAEGLYVMTSASSTKRSSAPPEAIYTAFTGKLIEVARKGVTSITPLLSMSALFEEVRRQMRSTPWPLPEQCNTNSATNLALIRNVAYDPEAKPVRQVPQLDLRRSRAVLIGVEHYSEQDYFDLPECAAHAHAMRDALLDRDLCGFSSEHCRMLVDPADPLEFGRVLTSAAQEAEDILLVYYTGHVDLSDTGELMLMTSSSVSTDPFTCIPLSTISCVLRNSRASNIVVIIDACYSGGAATALVETGKATYFLAASGPKQQAVIGGDGNFTDNLLRTLNYGLPGGPVHLTPVDLFRGILIIEQQAWQQPQLSVFNSDNAPCLFRNKADEIQDQAYHRCSIIS